MFSMRSVKPGNTFMVGFLMTMTIVGWVFLTPVPGYTLNQITITEQIVNQSYGIPLEIELRINPGDYKVYAFAVGNNDAQGAYIGDSYPTNAPTSWFAAKIDNNSGNGWSGQYWEFLGEDWGWKPVEISLNWVTLSGYNNAFLFYDRSPELTSPLLFNDTYYGFIGSTIGISSGFEALYKDDSGAFKTFSDQTTVVPLPGGVWLLGSGLLCLAGLRPFRKS